MTAARKKPTVKPINSLADIPDTRAMQTFITANGRLAALQATEKAQKFAEEAWQIKTPKARLTLVQKILEISPLCADAYNLFPDIIPLPLAAKATVYERALAAATLTLGAGFKDYVGEFWTFLETRPYMRALYNLGKTCAELGDAQQAAAHFTKMLELNPTDDQNAATPLLACLLQLDQNTQAETLLASRAGPATIWAYGRLLTAYRLGQTPDPNLFKKARRANPHIIATLTHATPTPVAKRQHASVQEAVEYAALFGGEWHRTNGEIGWLKEGLK
jgi:tetratricopeptide (TPR) repeat protein